MTQKHSASIRKDGRYEAKGVGHDGRRKSFYGRTEAEAIAKAEASYGIIQDRTLYGYYASAYCPTVAGRSDGWKSQIRWAMDRYVLPEFGERDMASITRGEAQAFFNRLCRHLNATTLSKVKIIFSGVMRLAERDDQITRNPIAHVRLPSPQPASKRALSLTELAQLLRMCDNRVKPFILLAGCAGLRRGEALGVTRTSIKDGVLKVAQQVKQPKGGCIIDQRLKTGQSRREIPLPFVDELFSCGQVSAVFVCSDSIGGYLTPNNTRRALLEACIAAGVPQVSPHELRHTFISLMENELECPPAIVAALAGKTYQSITAGYSHASRKQMETWMNRFWQTLQAVEVEQEVRLA